MTEMSISGSRSEDSQTGNWRVGLVGTGREPNQTFERGEVPELCGGPAGRARPLLFPEEV